MNEKPNNEPGICMLLDEIHYTCDALSTEQGEQGFSSFVTNSISALLPGQPAPKWLYLYFNQPEILNKLSVISPGNTSEFVDLFEQFLGKEGMGPIYSIPLANAIYCLKNDIPLLSVDARDMLLSIRPDYHEDVKRYEQNVPDVSDKLRRIADGNPYPDIEPIDFYLLGTEGGRILAVGHGKGEEEYQNFMLDELAKRCKPNESVPEALFIRERMKGEGNIPRLSERELNKYLLLRMGAIIKSKSSQAEPIPFCSAVYCVQHRIPLLSKEAKEEELAKRPGYDLDCFMVSIAAPDISQQLDELRETDRQLKVPSVTPEPKKGLSIG